MTKYVVIIILKMNFISVKRMETLASLEDRKSFSTIHYLLKTVNDFLSDCSDEELEYFKQQAVQLEEYDVAKWIKEEQTQRTFSSKRMPSEVIHLVQKSSEDVENVLKEKVPSNSNVLNSSNDLNTNKNQDSVQSNESGRSTQSTNSIQNADGDSKNSSSENKSAKIVPIQQPVYQEENLKKKRLLDFVLPKKWEPLKEVESKNNWIDDIAQTTENWSDNSVKKEDNISKTLDINIPQKSETTPIKDIKEKWTMTIISDDVEVSKELLLSELKKKATLLREKSINLVQNHFENDVRYSMYVKELISYFEEMCSKNSDLIQSLWLNESFDEIYGRYKTLQTSMVAEQITRAEYFNWVISMFENLEDTIEKAKKWELKDWLWDWSKELILK